MMCFHRQIRLMFLVCALMGAVGCSSIEYKGLSGSETLFQIKGMDDIQLSENTVLTEIECLNVSLHEPKSATPQKKIVLKKLKWQTEKVDWMFSREQSPNQCAIATPTLQIDQHGYTTQLWLSVQNDQLLVNTTTALDIANRMVGIKTQSGNLVPFAKKHYATSAFWSGSLRKTLETNDALKIVVGGEELGMKTHEIAISLGPLKAIFPHYERCKRDNGLGNKRPGSI